MKQVLIDRYGAPEEVARCAEVPDVGAPAAGEVVFDVLALPPRMDLHQAAMVRINPPTALLLLTDIVALKPGDWVV